MATDIVIKKYRDNTWNVVYPRANWNNIENKPSTFPPSSHTHQYIKYNDTRNTETTPASAVEYDGMRIDFKRKVISHIPSTGDYTAEITMDAYADKSGGYPSQLGFSMSDLGEDRRLYFRSPKTTTEWGDWKTLAFTDDIPNIADWAKASTKPSYQFSEITNRYEHLLDWKPYTSEDHAMTPMSVALSMEHNANRLAFINGDLLTFEYSTDAGQTWTNYGYSAGTKSQFCTAGYDLHIGKTREADAYTVNSRTRITLTAQDGNSPARRVYTNPKKLLINVSTSPNLYVTIEVRTGTNYLAGDESKWVYLGEYLLTGWSGWNDIPCNLGTLGGSANQPGNYWQMRLTFRPGGVTSSTHCAVLGMRLIGPNLWASPSNMATNNHLYAYDMDQNAVFPNKVSATRINAGSGGTGSSDSSNSDKVTVNGGIIQINNYGKYVKIGNRNTAYAHFSTDVTQGFYFNKQIEVEGSVLPYTNNSFNLGTLANRWAGVYADTLNTNTIDTSGNITLKVDSGDSPSIIFQRGNLTTDSYNDWKIYDSSGHLMFDRCNNSGSWSQILKIDGDLGVYFKNNKLALLNDIPDVSALAPKNSPVFSNKITIGSTEIAPANTGDISLTLPAGDGQLALKEDIPNVSGKLDKTGGTLTGTLDINTTNLNALSVKGLGAAILKVDGTHPSSGSDYLSIYATDASNSTNRKIIIQNGYGDVGIGTSNPSAKLDVSGNLNATTIYENGTALTSKYLQTSGGTVGSGGTGESDSASPTKLGVKGGILRVLNYGNYIEIGSTNSSFTHIITNQKVYLNKDLWIDGNLLPYSPTRIRDLGTPDRYWRNLYAATIYEDGVKLEDKYQAKGSGGDGITLEPQGKLVVEDGDIYFVNRTDFNFPVGNYIMTPVYDDSIGEDEHTYVGCVTACTRTGYVTFDAYNPVIGDRTYINIQDGDVASMSAGSFNCVFNIYRLV